MSTVNSAGASTFLQDPAFIGELEQAARESDKTLEQAQKYAGKCLREIEATPQDAWLRPMARMARFIYTRSYDKQLDINLDAVENCVSCPATICCCFCGPIVAYGQLCFYAVPV